MRLATTPYLVCFFVVLSGCGRPAGSVALEQPAPEMPASKSRPVSLEAREARRTRVRRDAYAFLSECERAAGGDWKKWEAETARYRAPLKARLDAIKRVGIASQEAMVARDLPIFEGNPRMNLAHVVDPDDWNDFRKTRAVVAANRWLRERGIDLIFVAVPAMPEVYIEQFLVDAPPDGVVAPHVRETFLELAENDVEVVNTFQLMRDVRNQGFEYLPADHHWNQFGMQGTVREVADRLTRYQFGQEARRAPSCTKTTAGPYSLPPGDKGADWRPPGRNLISEDQWKSALGTLPKTMDYITAADGSPVADDPRSPVVLIGNSFAMYFREMLVREANLPLRTRWANGNTTEAFAGFLREPEVLDGVRVVVWVTANDSIFQFRPMPDPIMETLRETR
jgi:SGNH hydrolase-like domain, acetyltransferase AlgX